MKNSRAKRDGSRPSVIQELAARAPRRSQIHIVASKLFVEKGYDGTSMQDIADAMNLTKAGLYHFVQSKEDLLFEIMREGMDRLDEQVIEPARGIADPLERLKAVVRLHVRNVGGRVDDVGNPLVVVVDEPAGLTPEHRREIEGRKRAYFNLVRATLDELAAADRIDRSIDSTAVAFSIIGAIMWVARWRRLSGRLGPEAIAEQLIQLTLHGVLANP